MAFPWVVFLIPPAFAGITGAIIKLSGGSKFWKAGLLVVGWNRTHGYRAGEGFFTDRPFGNTYYAIEAKLDSEYDLNKGLGALQATLPVDFEPFKDMKFDMTVSESNLLRTMLDSAVDSIKASDQARALWRQFPNEPDARHMAFEAYKAMRKTAQPVLTYLHQFPKNRTKKL